VKRSNSDLPTPRPAEPALAFDAQVRLEDLIDRGALTELTKSFYALFGIPVRIYSNDGLLLADASGQHEICAYMNALVGGRKACGETVRAVRQADPGEKGDAVHPCFTGNSYRIIALDYDSRRVGRIILGPFAPSSLGEPPKSILEIDEAIDRERARSLLAKVPRAKPETITRIGAHLKSALDLILFSGHKALLTSQMHLLSVRESYRELEENTQKLQEAYDRLKELDRLKSNFLATVSHELRTPLTSIIGYSEMLTEGIAGELSGEQREFVATIHEKGEQLLGLIKGLLDLSKLESGTMSMRRRSILITEVLDEVQSTLAPIARKKGVELRLETDGARTELRADPERLRQVFINLVDNAIKFTPAAGTVTMRARTIDVSPQAGTAPEDEEGAGFALMAPAMQKVEVRVMDTGIGIPEKERIKVFDPFYQVDSSSTREYGGTGLGLSIVKRLVEAHGGTVRVEGNAPRGAVFVVDLPPATQSSVHPPPGSSPFTHAR
jgi:two-component system, NarL family, sensor histidine kinase BarA